MKTELLTTRSQTLDLSANLKVKENEAGTSLSDYGMDSIPIKQEETNIKFENYSNNEKMNTSRVVGFGCKHYNLKFPTQSLSDAHMRGGHNIDPNSLDFYCQPCNSKYPERKVFRNHLRQVHKINFPSLKPKPNPNIKPDPSDYDFYCKSCDFKYLTNGGYKSHLRCKHKMNIPLLRSKSNPDVEPDLNDPNFYCKSCDYKYVNRARFLQHLKQMHQLTLKNQAHHKVV